MIENVAFGDPFADLDAHDNCTGRCYHQVPCDCGWLNLQSVQQEVWYNIMNPIQAFMRSQLS